MILEFFSSYKNIKIRLVYGQNWQIIGTILKHNEQKPP